MLLLPRSHLSSRGHCWANISLIFRTTCGDLFIFSQWLAGNKSIIVLATRLQKQGQKSKLTTDVWFTETKGDVPPIFIQKRHKALFEHIVSHFTDENGDAPEQEWVRARGRIQQLGAIVWWSKRNSAHNAQMCIWACDAKFSRRKKELEAWCRLAPEYITAAAKHVTLYQLLSKCKVATPHWWPQLGHFPEWSSDGYQVALQWL